MQASSSAAAASSKSLPGTSSSTVTSKSSKAATVRAESDSNCEIEEISKKISEHADAIFDLWKYRNQSGLAPTELLDFYTAAVETTSPDFFGASKAVVGDEASAEGLQQLVKTFVTKDKQQRNAKVNSMSSSSSTSISNNKKTAIITTRTEDALRVHLKNQKTGNIMKQAKPVTQRPSAIFLQETTADAMTAATKASKTTKKINDEKSPSATNSKSSIREPATGGLTARRNACDSGDRFQNTTKDQQQAATTPTKTKVVAKFGSNNKKLIKEALVGPALNLDLGLDLDLNALTQLQTENLLKIKELLQQESVTATEKPKKTFKTTTSATTENHIKRTVNEHVAKNAATGAAAAATTNVTTAARRTTATSSNHDDNAKTAVNSNDVVAVVADKNSNCTKKSSTNITPATPIIAANKTLLNEPLVIADGSSSISSSNANENKNKTKTDDKSIKTKSIKTSNINSRNNNNNTNNNNNIRSCNKNSSSNNNSVNKIVREKSVASVKNTSKVSTSAASAVSCTETTAATAAATAAATLASAAAASLAAPENVTEAARSSMPAPTKVKSSRPLTNGQDKNLGRSMLLTRGSVAEKCLMFEKCPDVRNSFLNIKRPDPADAPPRSLLRVKLHSTPPSQEQNLLQKEIRTSGKSVYIPRFYFPHGKPQPQIAIERTLRGILSAFDTFPNNQVTKDELPRILKLCSLPFYWRMPVMVFCQHGQSGLAERQRFVEYWKQMNVYCHDNASRFVYILSRGQRFRSYILPEDLAPLVQDVVDTHPGLAFLKEATEFHSRYVHTVIARIFYSVNRSWSGKISISELKKSDLLEIIVLLEEEDDINQIMAFFSYEHFYVIYCKFWELDRDHDLLINQDDLARYSDHALSTRIIERIFSGCVTRNDNKKDPDDEPKMSYTDFVWFLLSEEDKRTPTAIEYWFRCMDLDGDGVLSMYELEYFYEEQEQRMESIGIETLPFEDCLCQMLDMIKPQNRDCITLGDLKRCKMTHVFFDTFFNLEKYLDHEQRDPFASQRDEYATDWDRFAAQEYELLITEENE